MSDGRASGGFGIFTVDVEDWYHGLIRDPDRWAACEDRILGPTEHLLGLLRSTGNHGTFFVLGSIAKRHPELVRRIVEDGHEVGCHGYQHISLKRLDPAQFREDLERALAALREAGAQEVVSYRAPFFSLERKAGWALDILADCGIRIDSSVFPMRIGYYGSARARNHPHLAGRIWEYPVTLPSFGGLRLPLAGGFYCRFFPLSWTLAGIRYQLSRGAEPVFYIHPWELDPEHPRITVGRFLTYRHYLRLDRTEQVLRELLQRWRWRSLRECHAAREEGARREGWPGRGAAHAGR